MNTTVLFVGYPLMDDVMRAQIQWVAGDELGGEVTVVTRDRWWQQAEMPAAPPGDQVMVYSAESAGSPWAPIPPEWKVEFGHPWLDGKVSDPGELVEWLGLSGPSGADAFHSEMSALMEDTPGGPVRQRHLAPSRRLRGKPLLLVSISSAAAAVVVGVLVWSGPGAAGVQPAPGKGRAVDTVAQVQEAARSSVVAASKSAAAVKSSAAQQAAQLTAAQVSGSQQAKSVAAVKSSAAQQAAELAAARSSVVAASKSVAAVKSSAAQQSAPPATTTSSGVPTAHGN